MRPSENKQILTVCQLTSWTSSLKSTATIRFIWFLSRAHLVGCSTNSRNDVRCARLSLSLFSRSVSITRSVFTGTFSIQQKPRRNSVVGRRRRTRLAASTPPPGGRETPVGPAGNRLEHFGPVEEKSGRSDGRGSANDGRTSHGRPGKAGKRERSEETKVAGLRRDDEGQRQETITGGCRSALSKIWRVQPKHWKRIYAGFLYKLPILNNSRTQSCSLVVWPNQKNCQIESFKIILVLEHTMSLSRTHLKFIFCEQLFKKISFVRFNST